MSGNIQKDSRYRSNLLENITANHPMNLGIIMQVHHLISEKAIKKSGVASLLVAAGYDINDISNLVSLPSTLPGACHLEVQLHRGDHTEPFNDNDEDHPTKYHKFITKRLNGLEREIKSYCGQDKRVLEREVKKHMDELSMYILMRISSFTIPLTSISESFQHDNEGCKSSLTIAKHNEAHNSCWRQDRNHKGTEHSYSKKSSPIEIKFDKSNMPYKLEVGK